MKYWRISKTDLSKEESEKLIKEFFDIHKMKRRAYFLLRKNRYMVFFDASMDYYPAFNTVEEWLECCEENNPKSLDTIKNSLFYFA